MKLHCLNHMGPLVSLVGVFLVLPQPPPTSLKPAMAALRLSVKNINMPRTSLSFWPYLSRVLHVRVGPAVGLK